MRNGEEGNYRLDEVEEAISDMIVERLQRRGYLRDGPAGEPWFDTRGNHPMRVRWGPTKSIAPQVSYQIEIGRDEVRTISLTIMRVYETGFNSRALYDTRTLECGNPALINMIEEWVDKNSNAKRRQDDSIGSD